MAALAGLIGCFGCGAGSGTEKALPPGPSSTDPPGDSVLYVASARGDSVDAYRLDANGLLPATPFSSIELLNPRRLTVSGKVLYVALDDRLVALELAADGSLPATATASTQPVVLADYREMKVDNGMLYVAVPGRNSVTAFDLDDNGQLPPLESSSSSSFATDYRSIELFNGFLYAVSISQARIDTFLLDVNGDIPDDFEPQVPSTLVSIADDMVIRNGVLYVTDRSSPGISAYEIKVNGLLPADPDSRTRDTEAYVHLLINATATRIYATGFNIGRVDAFDLDPVTGSLLSETPDASTFSDTASFPSRMVLASGVLYVAQAGLDRVDAYVLGADGYPPPFPSSSTEAIAGSFPTDLAHYTPPQP
ncbi:MAG: hypothetical protein ACE5E4_07365 [Candidatus Binatia bacterium]